ncbi:AAA family ATPase [Termitidicoccus mucosus]|uniref:McrB family protein n=1 Tax=Termitidicoccus mucosus TaxID=1184151 RepID=UPI002FEE1F55
MNYYKTGCNWKGPDGEDLSPHDNVLKEYHIAIFDPEEFQPQPNDRVAFANGYKIFAIGIIGEAKGQPLNDALKAQFIGKIPEKNLKQIYYYEVKWYDLPPANVIEYKEQKGCVRIGKGEVQRQIEEEILKNNQNAMLNEITSLLAANHNIILTGAPGTGKTFLAKQVAAKLILGNDDKLPDNDRRLGFVQFHPSYDYTDFVEGLRPKNENGHVGFDLKNGIFKQFCKDALSKSDDKSDDKSDEKFVFIIDEINRGEISKIFGELFFAIDRGYRGEKGKVQTQYANLIQDGDKFKDGFFVPKNVYIIGTMNDIDRSVESFDFAMRRRFVFREITADDSATNMGLLGPTKARMKWLNNAIEDIEELNAAYHIGGSYFRKEDEQSKVVIEPNYDKLWTLKIAPLLKEYLRGMPNADAKLEKLKKAYDDGGRQPDNNAAHDGQ